MLRIFFFKACYETVYFVKPIFLTRIQKSTRNGGFFFFVYLPTVNMYYFWDEEQGRILKKANWSREEQIWQVSEYKEWQKDENNDREDDMERRD